MKKCFSLILSMILIALSITSAPFSVSASEQSIAASGAVTDILFGDVNGDRAIDNNDVIWVKSYRDDVISFTEEQKVLADVNGNGEIDATDQSIIREVAEGKDVYSMPIYGMLLDAGCCGVNISGDNVKYLLKADGTLIIFGEGEMFNNLNEYMDQALEYVPWYSNRSSVKTVEIKNGVTSIGKRVFEKSPNLTSVVIPDSVESINRNAFAYCTSLTDIMLPGSLTLLDKDLFLGCTSLVDITIPDGVATIGEAAFDSCQSLTNVILPKSLTNIAQNSFRYCTSLTEIEFPNSLTDIGGSAFENCTGLKSIAFPDNLDTIGAAAFYACSSLTSIIIPQNVTSIGGSAFSSCSNLESIEVDPDNTVFDSRDNCNAIIQTASGRLCFGCKNTVIPEGIISLGYHAFNNCSDLTEITIPDSVRIIGESAFSGCVNLQAITFPEGLTTIHDFAFSSCQSLKSIHIPAGVTMVGEYSNPFSGCSGLSNITVDETNEVYDSRDNCNAIIKTASNSIITGCKTTVIPDTVIYISLCAFSNCTGLTGITLPNSITGIGSEAFYGCTNLLGIVISDSVTSIKDNAFMNCTNLSSVVIDASVKSIGRSAFSGCMSLTDVFFTGSQEQWSAISIGMGNDPLKNAAIHFNYAPGTDDCEKLGLQHAWSKTYHIPPTCMIDGRNEYTCIRCSAAKTETVNAFGHTAGDWETVKEPTDTKEGLRVRKCTTCGNTIESEPIPVSALQSSGKFVAESVSGQVGEMVDLKINIEDNPGVTSLQLKVEYSAADLELTEIIDNSLFDSSISHGRLTSNPIKISWFSNLSENRNDSGTLATLRFRIKPGAKDSAVTISFDQANIFNINGQEISFDTVDGTVSVDAAKTLSSIAVSKMPTKTVYEIGESLDTSGMQLKLTYDDRSVSYITSGFTTSGFNSASAGTKTITIAYMGKTTTIQVSVNPSGEQPTESIDSPKFVVKSTYGMSNETVDVKVNIENNPSITALQIKIGYSSEDLELIEVKDNNLFGSPISGSKYLTDNPQIISWYSRDSEDHSENGTIATLRFKIKPNAKDSNITLSFKKSNIFNSSFDEFDFQAVNGTVYVTGSAVLMGDVDFDGNVEIHDATWIQRSVADFEIPFAIKKLSADVDGDNNITVMDATAIQYYLANMKNPYHIGEQVSQ